jgi:hypothetical protein
VDGNINADTLFAGEQSLYYDASKDKMRFSKRIHSGTGTSGHSHAAYSSSQATKLDLWKNTGPPNDNRYSYIYINHFLPSNFTGTTCTVRVFYMISGGTDPSIQWYYSAGATAVGSVPDFNIASWASQADAASDNTVLNELVLTLNDTDLGASKNLSLAFEPRFIDDGITNMYILGYKFQYETTGTDGSAEVYYPSTAASYTDSY